MMLIRSFSKALESHFQINSSSIWAQKMRGSERPLDVVLSGWKTGNIESIFRIQTIASSPHSSDPYRTFILANEQRIMGKRRWHRFKYAKTFLPFHHHKWIFFLFFSLMLLDFSFFVIICCALVRLCSTFILLYKNQRECLRNCHWKFFCIKKFLCSSVHDVAIWKFSWNFKWGKESVGKSRRMGHNSQCDKMLFWNVFWHS